MSLITIESTLEALPAGPGVTVGSQLQAQLSRLPPEQQLDQVLLLIDHGAMRQEQTVEVVAEAWAYLAANDLWKADRAGRYTSLESLKARLDAQANLEDLLQAHRTIRDRKSEGIEGIRRNWGSGLDEALPADLLPPWFSKHVLQGLNALSKITGPRQAEILLRRAIRERQELPGLRKAGHLLLRDVTAAVTQAKAEPATDDEAAGGPAQPGEATDKTMQLGEAGGEPARSGAAMDEAMQLGEAGGGPARSSEASDEAVRLGEASGKTAPSGEATDGAMQQTGTVAMGGATQQTSSVAAGGTMQLGEATARPTQSDEAMDTDGESVEEQTAGQDETEDEEQDGRMRTRSKTVTAGTLTGKTVTAGTLTGKTFTASAGIAGRPCKGRQGAGRERSETAAMSRLGPDCLCPEAFQRQYFSQRGRAMDDEKALTLVGVARACGLHEICHLHLRELAGLLGLKNNLSMAALGVRLRTATRYRNGDLGALRQRKPDWFRAEHAGDQHELMVYRLAARPAVPFTFDADRVFERFGGPGSWSTWQEQGTITFPRLLGHLDEADLRQLVDEEFAMYRHHELVPAGKTRQGWMRHMLHSLVQQAVRMDPVWYALVAAARPDRQWRLISYPYVAKDADPGESTGFLHLDLNVAAYVEDGAGGNLMSTSLALDDEREDGCTVVVPGFHQHIAAWHREVVARGEQSAGRTTNCRTAYRKEDRERWGAPVAQPCTAYSVRLTKPAIIHGSTAKAGLRRRNLFPWYVGILDDHATLDNQGRTTWTDLASLHRDRLMPPAEPTGQARKHKVPDWAFPGSVLLPRSSALGAALLGERRWTDPTVIRERDVLLGEDDGEAVALAGHIREGIVAAYRSAWEEMARAEAAAYGEQAYFGRRAGEAGEK